MRILSLRSMLVGLSVAALSFLTPALAVETVPLTPVLGTIQNRDAELAKLESLIAMARQELVVAEQVKQHDTEVALQKKQAFVAELAKEKKLREALATEEARLPDPRKIRILTAAIAGQEVLTLAVKKHANKASHIHEEVLRAEKVQTQKAQQIHAQVLQATQEKTKAMQALQVKQQALRSIRAEMHALTPPQPQMQKLEPAQPGMQALTPARAEIQAIQAAKVGEQTLKEAQVKEQSLQAAHQATELALAQIQQAKTQAIQEVQAKEQALKEAQSKQQALSEALAKESDLAPDQAKIKKLKAALVQQEAIVQVTKAQAKAAELAEAKALQEAQKREVALNDLLAKEKTLKDSLPQHQPATPLIAPVEPVQPQIQPLVAPLQPIASPTQPLDTLGTPLGQLVDWPLPVLNNAIVSNIQTTGQYAIGDITIAGKPWQVEIVKVTGTSAVLVLSYKDRIRPAQLVSQLDGTALNDLEFETPLFVWAAADDDGRTISLPDPLSQRMGAHSLALQKGLRLTSPVHLQGKTAHLFSLAGLSAGGPWRLSGSFDPQIFTGTFSGDAAKKAFIANLDLSIPLPDLNIPDMARQITFSSASLRVKGKTDGSAIIGGIESKLSIPLASGERRDFVSALTVSSDGVNLDIMGRLEQDWEHPLGITWLKLSQVSVSVTKENSQTKVTIAGDPHITAYGGQEDLKATLTLTADSSGVTDAIIALSGASLPLGKLVDWELPVLTDVTVSEMTLGEHFIDGGIAIAGQPWEITIFKGPGQNKSALLISSEKPIIPADLVGLKGKGTGLEDIELDKPTFFWAAREDQGHSAALPGPVAQKTGLTSITLQEGLRTSSQARLVKGSRSEKLVAMAGLPTDTALPLQGTFDPSIFSGSLAAESIMHAFIAKLDLDIALPDIKPPGIPAFVKFSSPTLKIKGAEDGSAILGGLATDITTHLPAGQKLSFLGALTISSDGQDLDIKGKMLSPWKTALGVPWLELSEVTFEIARNGSQREVSIGGKTDIGRIKNLDATLALETVGEQINNVGISLTGTEIPLDQVPGVNSIPAMEHFTVRDLYLGSHAIAGTFFTNLKELKVLNGLTGTLFELDGEYNLALARNGCSLTDLLPPLPAPMLEPLKSIRIDRGAIVLSSKPAKAPVGNLPDGARQFFAKIYGSESELLRFGGGISLVASLDLGAHAKALSSIGRVNGNPVFSGEIDGLLGGEPSIKFMADLPTIALPKMPAFLVMPEDFQAYFFISANTSEAAVGIGLAADTKFNTSPQPVTFGTQFEFEADTSGGLSIDIQGITDTAWDEVLGIKGLVFKPGTRLEIKVSATMDVTLTIVGLTEMGSKEVKAIMSTTVNLIEEFIDKGAFEGSIDSLSLEDFVQLSNRIVAASGGTPSKPDFPNVTLKKVDFAFASPGVDVPELNITGGGIRFGGELWALFPDAPLGDFFAQLDFNGLIMKGDLHDFQAGPVMLHNSHLDTRSTVMPPEAYFKMTGGGKLLGVAEDFSVVLGDTRMALISDLNAGPMLEFDFRAFADLPGVTMSRDALAKSDLGLSSHLKSDLSAWLRDIGMQKVKTAMAVLDAELPKAKQALDQAQKGLDQLDAKINQARKVVAKSRSSQKQQIQTAQSAVDKLDQQIDDLSQKISHAKSKIQTCDQMHTTCVVRNPFNGKCVKKAKVADLKARYTCDKDNLEYGAVVTKGSALQETLHESLKLAKESLQKVKEGTESVPVDLDPRVSELLADRETALAGLEFAKQAVEEASKGDETISRVIDMAKKPGALVIKDSLIQGSLRKALSGTPSVIAIDFQAFGQDYHQGLAFSLTDQSFNAEQLEVMALFAVTQAAKADPKFPDLIMRTLQQVYEEKHTNAVDKLEAALKANGLE